jgi:type II secretory pathway pseudopilin PulG
MRARERKAADGYSVVDLVIVLTIVFALTAMAVPLTAHTRDLMRARLAASAMAAELRQARIAAVATRRTTAVVFDMVNTRWVMRRCQDGNGNGVRRADVVSGVDPCSGGPVDINQRFPGVLVAVDPTVAGPEGSPASPDPVRFGSSNMMSCTPSGGCTPGTLFLRSASGDALAVRLGNMTGRARALRYHQRLGQWLNE